MMNGMRIYFDSSPRIINFTFLISFQPETNHDQTNYYVQQ